MEVTFWIIMGVCFAVLALSVWRVSVWYSKHPGRVLPVQTPLYKRVQLVRFVFVSAMMAALLVVVAVWPDVEFWVTMVEVVVALVLVGLGTTAITSRMWRCPHCGAQLPSSQTRAGVNPANLLTCPDCGQSLAGSAPRSRKNES